jgi:glyoxylase-like metal-dependent hydrolase (beta-lactamase superfamily II)
MKIDYLILGGYQTNCYILRKDESAKDCLIIDPGLEAGELIEFLDEQKLNPVAVVLTHGHIDHIAGVAALRSRFPEIKVYIHNLDSEMLTDPNINLSAMSGAGFVTEAEDVSLKERDTAGFRQRKTLHPARRNTSLPRPRPSYYNRRRKST